MIAKVLAWGHDRDEAVRRMRRALAEFVVVGIDTNVPLHLRILRDPRFLAGDIHTTFLEREFEATPGSDDEEEAHCPAGGRCPGASTREAGTGEPSRRGTVVPGRRTGGRPRCAAGNRQRATARPPEGCHGGEAPTEAR